MAGKTREGERAFQMSCFLKIWPLIHVNPITAAGGLIETFPGVKGNGGNLEP